MNNMIGQEIQVIEAAINSCNFLSGGGMRGGKTVIIEPHRHPGVFIARGKEDALVTLNLVPGDAVYGEKRITVEVR